MYAHIHWGALPCLRLSNTSTSIYARTYKYHCICIYRYTCMININIYVCIYTWRRTLKWSCSSPSYPLRFSDTAYGDVKIYTWSYSSIQYSGYFRHAQNTVYSGHECLEDTAYGDFQIQRMEIFRYSILGMSVQWENIVSFTGLFCKRDVNTTFRTTSSSSMEWLRLAGSLKLKVSFAKQPYKVDDMGEDPGVELLCIHLLMEILRCITRLELVIELTFREIYTYKHYSANISKKSPASQVYFHTHPLQHKFSKVSSREILCGAIDFEWANFLRDLNSPSQAVTAATHSRHS